MIPRAKQPKGQGSKYFFLLLRKYNLKQVSHPARLFLFVALSLCGETALAMDLNWSPEQINAHQLIIRYRLADADALLSTLPASPAKAYLLNLRDFVELVYNEDEAHFQQYTENLPVRKSWIEDLPDGSPERAFYLADMALQEALFKIKFGEYVSGLYLLLQANSQITEIQERDDQILAFLKPAGVINMLIGFTPQKYEWAVRLIGLKGDLETGEQQLTSLASSTSPLSSEALILLGYFYAYPLRMPDEAVRCFSSVLVSQPDNLLATFMVATSLNKGHCGKAALEAMDAQSPNTWSQFPQAFYLLGTLYLQKGSYELSREFLHQFVKTYAGKTFKKDATTKIALSYYLEGEIAAAEAWKQKALAVGSTSSEPDKNAAVILDEISEYPLHLLRARLLTDGGYWNEAGQQLAANVGSGSLGDRWICEYHYRRGRLCQLQQQQESALTSYAEALKLAENKDWYVGASSALQAGLIFKARGNDTAAVALLKKAKGFGDHPYKASIDMQADRALASLASN